MSSMLAILKREIKSYFQNVVGWLFVGAIVAVYGIYFFAYNLQGGYPYISYALSGIAYILFIAVPVLSMRSIAEERKSKVDQLLLTAPVSIGKMVLAKYLAMVAVYSVAVGIIGITPLILSTFGTVPMGENYVVIFGFWLMGCLFLAIGLFLSSITESQVIAAVLSFVVLFLGFMMNSILSLLGSSETIVTKILSCLDIYTPFSNFVNGCLDLSATFYYVAGSGLMIFLTIQSIQKRRWSISKNTVSTSVYSTSAIGIALALVIVGNLIVENLPVNLTRLDFTYTKMYDLTEDTEVFLKNLEEDITIYVIAAEAVKDANIDETVKRYESLSKHISVEYIDPTINPKFAQKYTDATLNQNSVIVVGPERAKAIDYYELYEVEYTMDYYSYSYTSTVTGYDAEGQITSAIEYVTMDAEELAVVYEITGHGETSLSASFTDVLDKANIRLETLELFNEEAIPEDAQAIIIHAPTSDYNEADAKKVIDYINGGGNVILTCNYANRNLANFDSILQTFGLDWVDGVVAENSRQNYYSGNPFYLLPEINNTDYTESVYGDYVLAVYGVGITYGEDTDSISYQSLMDTSDSAVSKTKLDNITTSQYEDGDVKGGFSLGVAATITNEDASVSQLVVLGSSMILTDDTNTVVSGNHAAMFTDIISQMTTETELSSSVIPVKGLSLSNLTINTLTGLIIAGIIVVVLPLALLGYGISIWYVRRRK